MMKCGWRQWEVPLELSELVDVLVEEPHEEVIVWHRECTDGC